MKNSDTLRQLDISIDDVDEGEARLAEDGNVRVLLRGAPDDRGICRQIEFTLKPWAAWELGNAMPMRLAILSNQLVNAGLAGSTLYQAAGRARDVTPPK